MGIIQIIDLKILEYFAHTVTHKPIILEVKRKKEKNVNINKIDNKKVYNKEKSGQAHKVPHPPKSVLGSIIWLVPTSKIAEYLGVPNSIQ